MKKSYVILILLAFSCSVSFGQTAMEPITIEERMGAYRFYQGDKRLNMRLLKSTLKPNEEAYRQVKIAQSTRGWATLFAGVGGFLVGWEAGNMISGDDVKWWRVAVGGGLSLVSIPINQAYKQQVDRAMNTYNGGLETGSFLDKKELRLSMTSNGIGLSLKF